MKKTGLVYLLVVLLLSAAAMLARLLELRTVLDAGGLAVFRPATAVMIVLGALTAVFCILFVRRCVQPRTGAAYIAEYPSLGLPGVVLGAACLLVQLYGAWLLFRSWKSEGDALDLCLAILAGLAGAGWLSMRIDEWKNRGGFGSRFLSGCVVTLFYCLWLIAYYRDEAPEPSIVLTVYGFLSLCACCVAAYYVAGGSVGRLRPRPAAVFCGLAVFLCLTALVRSEPTGYRLFWLAGAVQFALSAFVLLGTPDPFPEPEKEEAEPEGEAESESEAQPEEPEAESGPLPPEEG